MSELSKVESILQEIRKLDIGFMVNNDFELTDEVKKRILEVEVKRQLGDISCELSQFDANVKINNNSSEHMSHQHVHTNESISAMTHSKDITSWKKLRSDRKIIGRLITFVKRLIRKLTFWYIEPICQQQTVFNNSVTSAVMNITETNNRLAELLNQCINQQNNNEESIINLKRQAEGNEDWLRGLTTRIEGNEDWLRGISNKCDGVFSSYKNLRDELFFELRRSTVTQGADRNVNEKNSNYRVKPSYKEKLEKYGKVKLNVGSATIDVDGYINVDYRDLSNVDIVADVKRLPFREEEVDEIYAAHVIEHFIIDDLEKTILPHWKEVLKPGGKLVIIVPNMDKMLEERVNNRLSFEDFKEVTFGTQEYEGNYHYSMFNVSSVVNLLETTGYRHIDVVAEDRRNGLCYELEIHCYKDER